MLELVFNLNRELLQTFKLYWFCFSQISQRWASVAKLESGKFQWLLIPDIRIIRLVWGGKGGWKLYCQLNFSKVLWKMAKLNYFASYSKDQRGENKMQTELFDSNWIKDPHQKWFISFSIYYFTQTCGYKLESWCNMQSKIIKLILPSS